ncbi:MAG: hypothetical protein ACYDHY_10460 [Acidiferrobacterales bacterium]
MILIRFTITRVTCSTFGSKAFVPASLVPDGPPGSARDAHFNFSRLLLDSCASGWRHVSGSPDGVARLAGYLVAMEGG